MHHRKSLNISPLLLIFLLVAFLAVGYFLVKGLYNQSYWLVPLLIILTLMIRPKTLSNYFRWLLRLFKLNVVTGLLMSAVTIAGYPFVIIFLFFKALFVKGFRLEQSQAPSTKKGEYIEYEDLDDELVELPPIESYSKKKFW